MTPQSTVRPKSAVAAHPITSAVIVILVAATIFVILYTPIYSRITPKIGDFPFFYAYLLIIMPITSVALWLVMLLQKQLERSGQALRAPHGEAGK